MQVLIEIPELKYKVIQNACYHSLASHDMANMILNGIVLPESHGDLIDRDELKRYARWYNLATDKSIHAVLTKEIDWMEPVIEGTKEGD